MSGQRIGPFCCRPRYNGPEKRAETVSTIGMVKLSALMQHWLLIRVMFPRSVIIGIVPSPGRRTDEHSRNDVRRIGWCT